MKELFNSANIIVNGYVELVGRFSYTALAVISSKEKLE